ncbi:hypothetical protein PAXRUDRAFT_166697 [Paxillus rubicundulus Ve08.2h10]|uniref:Uncharacterized protein n=1 Tax=Paxillus rubicundulus Ve08.2h10 TaxID=930991 RepID=A0A0D0DAH1_9AGAM|nr:hypothetical protein PAXRUDRAFT_166697 [Paxillus rubicundulus Ve08.2h10]
MTHCEKATCELIDKLNESGGVIDMFNDFFQGCDYLDAVNKGKIKVGDTILMLSLDGAQLYWNKQSDFWMYIWVIYELSPDLRYKKKYVLPGAVIPGLNKPKNMESFLFPGLHQLSAVQQEGLKVWDAF